MIMIVYLNEYPTSTKQNKTMKLSDVILDNCSSIDKPFITASLENKSNKCIKPCTLNTDLPTFVQITLGLSQTCWREKSHVGYVNKKKYRWCVHWCLQSTTYDVGRMLGVAIKLNAQCSGAPYVLLNYKFGFKKKKLLKVDINMHRKDISFFMTYF